MLIAAVILASSSVLVLSSPHYASAATSCGDTITTSTTLTSDLVGCAGDGIDVGASNIVLNCNGHAISGTSSSSNGIFLPFDITGVTIENCFINSFGIGIYLEGLQTNSYDKIIGNTISESGIVGVSIQSSNHNTIKNNVVTQSVGEGFFSQGSSYNYYAGNTASNTIDGNGFLLIGGSTNNKLFDNKASSNMGTDGFVLSSDSIKNVLIRNSADNNQGYGFEDQTSGKGTAGTANRYNLDECSGNVLGGSSPDGLCSQAS